MLIVDAQIHRVNPVLRWATGMSKEQRLEASAELAIASMDAAGVQKAIVYADLGTIHGYHDRYPDRFVGVPTAEFAGIFSHDPKEQAWEDRDVPAEEYMHGLDADPTVVGLRVTLSSPERVAKLLTGGYTAYFDAAEQLGLPLCFWMPGSLPALHETLRSHSKLPCIIDHVGLPAPPYSMEPNPEVFRTLPDVLALAQFSNVVVKFTGVPSLSMQPYPFDDVWPCMHQLIDAFGVDRLMWGSDITRCKPLHNYRESVDFLLMTDQVSEKEKETLFSESAFRWMRWPT